MRFHYIYPSSLLADKDELIARFSERTVTLDNGCLLWRGAKTHDGYGIVQIGSREDNSRRAVRLHRLIYFLAHGEIAPGLEISHTCGHRNCIAPEHLVAMDHAEVIERGQTGAHNRERARCPRGHAYDPSNTRHSKSGRRVCRECDRERKRSKRGLSISPEAAA